MDCLTGLLAIKGHNLWVAVDFTMTPFLPSTSSLCLIKNWKRVPFLLFINGIFFLCLCASGENALPAQTVTRWHKVCSNSIDNIRKCLLTGHPSAGPCHTVAGSSVLSSREIGRAWNRLEMDRGQVIGSHKVVLVCAILYPCSWARFTWTCSGNLAGAIDLLLELRLSPGLADECPLTLRIPQNCKLPLWGTAQAALSLLHWVQGIFNRIGLTESEPYCISAQKCLIIASGA